MKDNSWSHLDLNPGSINFFDDMSTTKTFSPDEPSNYAITVYCKNCKQDVLTYMWQWWTTDYARQTVHVMAVCPTCETHIELDGHKKDLLLAPKQESKDPDPTYNRNVEYWMNLP